MDNPLELVSLSLPTLDGEPFKTSTMIANQAEVKHYAFQQLIKKYTHDLQEFGKVAFEMQPVPSRQRTKIYLLNEQQATLIFTYLGNTALVREFKKAMARQFYATRKELLKRRSLTRAVQSGSMPIPGAIRTSVTCYAKRLPAWRLNSYASRSASSGRQRASTHIAPAEFTEYQCLGIMTINLLELGLPYEQIKYCVLAKARPIPRD